MPTVFRFFPWSQALQSLWQSTASCANILRYSVLFLGLYVKKMFDQTRRNNFTYTGKTSKSFVKARNKCLWSNVYPFCLRRSACTIILNKDRQFHPVWAKSCKKEEKLAKTIEIFGKKLKESWINISLSMGKKCLIKQEMEQFYPVKRANL